MSQSLCVCIYKADRTCLSKAKREIGDGREGREGREGRGGSQQRV